MAFLLRQEQVVVKFDEEREDPSYEDLAWFLIGEIPDRDAVTIAIRNLQQAAVGTPQNTATGRYAIYEESGDTDDDGIVDGYTFSELVKATTDEPKSTIRKQNRKK